LITLSLISLGISLIVKASIGQSTLSGFSYNFGTLLGLKQGTALGLLNFVFFLAQIPLLKKLGLTHFFQVIMIVISTLLTNLFIYDFNWIPFIHTDYPAQVGLLIIGIAVMALGVALMMVLDFVFMPFEGFIQLLAQRLDVSFGTLRRNIDIILVFLSLTMIFTFKLPNTTVREGTVLFALLVGSLNHRLIPFFKKVGWKDFLES
jgi:uncharacterized membrane protein YczE